MGRPPFPLVAIAILVVLVHVLVMAVAPEPRFWGDEPHYLQLATQEAQEHGWWSPFPGTLGFDHRPLFGVRVLALFAPDVYPAIAVLNLALLLGAVVLTYALARELALSPAASAVAAGLIGLFPWLGFHVHSLWPEVLHAVLLGGLLLLYVRHLKRGRPWSLVGAGVLAGYALLTKGTLGPFVPLFVGYLVWHGVRTEGSGAAQGEPLRRWGRGLAAAGAFLGPLLVVVLPQVLANDARGHGARLAANRWWNLELGLTVDGERRIRDVDTEYWAAAVRPADRERASEERVLRYVREQGPLRVAGAQLGKLWKLWTGKPAALERGLDDLQRWGPEPPAVAPALRFLGRAMWILVWIGGAIGAAACAPRGRPWCFLVCFAVAYLGALLAVPVKIRFALPLVPVLALFTAALVDVVAARLAAARRSHST